MCVIGHTEIIRTATGRQSLQVGETLAVALLDPIRVVLSAKAWLQQFGTGGLRLGSSHL
jgi:hypothetical protein